MEDSVLHVRMKKPFLESIQKTAKENNFANTSEFTKYSLRKTLDDFELQKSIQKLKKLQGSVKGIKRLSKEELDKAAEEWIKEDHSNIFREFGLDDVPKIK